jgi:hypothetical protein
VDQEGRPRNDRLSRHAGRHRQPYHHDQRHRRRRCGSRSTPCTRSVPRAAPN